MRFVGIYCCVLLPVLGRDVECSIDRVFPDAVAGLGVLESQLLAFFGANILVTLKETVTGVVFEPIAWLETTGDLKPSLAKPGTFQITGPSGGTVAAQDKDGRKCQATMKPIAQYFYYPTTEATYDYPCTAAQIGGGSCVHGEYYLDDDKSPIHLHTDAAVGKEPSDNWFKADSGYSANLVVEPIEKNKNNKYIPAAPGDLITEDEAAALVSMWKDPFAWCGTSTVWVVPTDPKIANGRPFVDASGKFPYGMAATLVKGTSTVVAVGADIPHCVMSRSMLQIPDLESPRPPTPAGPVTTTTMTTILLTTSQAADTSRATSLSAQVEGSTIRKSLDTEVLVLLFVGTYFFGYGGV